jgi:alginate O-acetyltransferase complex protein AlgI
MEYSDISSVFKRTLTKIILCGSGFLLLAFVGGSILPMVSLFACATITYGFALHLQASTNAQYKKIIGRWSVLFALALIVTLNLTGQIGTLTGTSDSAQSSFSLLLAAPFYFLSAAAFMSDIALSKLKMPKFLDYLTYLSLPFKLLAGPLELPRLLGQIERFTPRFAWWRFSAAWPWMAMGAFMKFVIANRLNPSANLDLTDPIFTLTTAAVFELKFYFDFAGYSFIGYGAALCIGFRMNKNFAHPFFASNVVNFWRQWHMSLGRFLSRYVLEPNLSFFSSRRAKVFFASCIFFVSALWHGGTLNYLLWGFFHAAVYFIYVSYLKRRNINHSVGILSMVIFFVMGRFFAIDANEMRLQEKIYSVFILSNYQLDNEIFINYIISDSEIKALIAAFLFLSMEFLSLRLYSSHRSYHLFRKPLFALFLLIIFIFFGTDTGNLLYARI